MLAVHEDGLEYTYWTAEQAAQAAGVTSATIRSWVHRSRLSQATDARGRPRCDDLGRKLYAALDVVRAELATRDKARRQYAVAA